MNSSAALSQVLDAVAFAARKHQGKFRKDEKTPYASHPFRVCLIMRDLFGHDDPRMLATALLHDVIEDTDTDFDDLAEQFSPEIARWVGFLTKDKRLPEPEREKAYLEQLLGAPWQVQVCKLADIYDNLSDMRTMPAEARAEKIGRLRHYLDGFQQSPHAELRRPLELARGQLSVANG
jgi:guanosine-3',5'-bis(diphosphate) 3'-pyrophosphohydrolase